MMSTPSPSTLRSKSVTRAATSINASATRSSPVISQSIQTSRSFTRGNTTSPRARLRLSGSAQDCCLESGHVREWSGCWRASSSAECGSPPARSSSPIPTRAWRRCGVRAAADVGPAETVGYLLPALEVVVGRRWCSASWCAAPPSSPRCCSWRSSSASRRSGRAGSRSTAAASAVGATTPTPRPTTRGRSPATSACSLLSLFLVWQRSLPLGARLGAVPSAYARRSRRTQLETTRRSLMSPRRPRPRSAPKRAAAAAARSSKRSERRRNLITRRGRPRDAGCSSSWAS